MNFGERLYELRKAKNMLMAWNTFISNLSGKQRKMLMTLYVLLIGVCIAIIFSFCYGTGYATGKMLYHLLN